MPEDLPKLAVPFREVPVPLTVSREFQEVVARPVPEVPPIPTTAEGWKAWQRQADGEVAVIADGLARELGISIEPARVGGVGCHRVAPRVVGAGKRDALLVHVHGGIFVFNAGLAGLREAILLADACEMPVLSIDYRTPPDHPFPAAPDDVWNVWTELLKGRDPARVVMGGTSAGAGLILTTMLRCKVENTPMPAALFLGTPYADLTKTGDSVFLNAEIDHILGRYEGRLLESTRLYAAGVDLADPRLSPLYGDLAGLPPAVLVSGTRDLLLSTTVCVHRKLRAAGIPAELHVYEGMSHADYMAGYPAPEAVDVFREVAEFFDRHRKA